MTVLTVACAECESTATVDVGQSFASGTLMWYESFRCPKCGASEEDGSGTAPSWLRDAIIESDGYWALDVHTNNENRLHAIKMLHCPFSEVAGVKDRFPGIVVAGTKTEMEWLKHRLETIDVESSVVEGDQSKLADQIDLPHSPFMDD